MKFYVAAQHNICQALGDIDYPVTKEALLESKGSEIIQIDFDKKIEFKEILEKLPLDSFSCAGELYNNISCVLW